MTVTRPHSVPRSPRFRPTARARRRPRRLQAVVEREPVRPAARRRRGRARRSPRQPLPRRLGDRAPRRPRRTVRRHRRRGPRRPGCVSILPSSSLAPSRPGDEVVYAWRSFEAYPGLVTVAGADERAGAEPGRRRPRPRRHGRGRHRPHPHRDRLHPEQPDRRRSSPTAEFDAFMARCPTTVLVVLDEAYAEFVTDPDAVDGESLLERHPNLVVLRTFSKAYGLAGLRVGYAIGPAYVLDAARATRHPAVRHRAGAGGRARLARARGRAARARRAPDRGCATSSSPRCVDQGWDVPRRPGQLRLAADGRAHRPRRRGVRARGHHRPRLRDRGPPRLRSASTASVDKLLEAAQAGCPDPHSARRRHGR